MNTSARLLASIALAGGVGSVARYLLSSWAVRTFPDARLPVGTLLVNVLGCVAAGLIAALAAKQTLISPEQRTWILVGLLGGFTTFSAFGLETVLLLKRGELSVAVLNVVLSVLLGVVAVWLGWTLIGARTP